MNAPHDLPTDPGLAVPPHSQEAEQSVLGALLLDNEAIDRIPDLRADQFYRYDHRVIFDCIARMIMAGRRADVVTVMESLGGAGKLDQVGGLRYLNTLAQNTPSAANIRRYAEIVIERAQLRDIMCAVDEIGAMVHNRAGKTAAEISAEAQARFEPISEARSFAPKEVGPVLTNIVEGIDRRYHGGELEVTPTGFRDLDAKMGGGMRGSELIVVAGRPSMGKAQPLDARVLTTSGWKAMGDLRIGDAIASVDGAPSLVTGIYPQGVKAVMRVSFTDGRSTEVCPEHLWSVHYKDWKTPRVLSTAEVSALMQQPSTKGRLWVDAVSGNFGSDHELPIDPWLLGALLGDGDFTHATLRFSKTASQTINRVRSTLPESVGMISAGGCDFRLSTDSRTARTSGNPLMHSIRELGLVGCTSLTKFVPQVYMTADRHARLNIVRGMLDTDGWVETFGSVRFSTSSLQLALDFQALVRSLGFWCSMKEKRPKYSNKGELLNGHISYVMTVSGAELESLFLFDEKRNRCLGRTRFKRIAFDSIEYSRDASCQCISVSHPSRLYVTDDYIVTHNTAFSMCIAGSVAQTGNVVLVFSLEMSAESLHQRNLARIGGIPLSHILDGKKIVDEDWPRLTHAVQVMSEMQMLVDDSSGLSLAEIVSRSRSVKRRAGRLDLIVVDYLGLMTGGTQENQNLRIASYSAGLKGLAKQLNVPVVLLSQLSREVEKRPNKRPIMADLRDSGAIEQDADLILFLYRDQVYNPDSPDRGTAEVIIAKQRNGETGPVRLAFDGEYQRFADLAPGYMPAPRKEPEKARRGFE